MPVWGSVLSSWRRHDAPKPCTGMVNSGQVVEILTRLAVAWIASAHSKHFYSPPSVGYRSPVTALMRACDSWDQFVPMIDRSLPRQVDLPLFEGKEDILQIS